MKSQNNYQKDLEALAICQSLRELEELRLDLLNQYCDSSKTPFGPEFIRVCKTLDCVETRISMLS